MMRRLAIYKRSAIWVGSIAYLIYVYQVFEWRR